MISTVDDFKIGMPVIDDFDAHRKPRKVKFCNHSIKDTHFTISCILPPAPRHLIQRNQIVRLTRPIALHQFIFCRQQRTRWASSTVRKIDHAATILLPRKSTASRLAATASVNAARRSCSVRQATSESSTSFQRPTKPCTMPGN